MHYNARYAMNTVTLLMKTENYFAYFHSVMSHGTMKEVHIQKNIIRIRVGAKRKNILQEITNM